MVRSGRWGGAGAIEVHFEGAPGAEVFKGGMGRTAYSDGATGVEPRVVLRVYQGSHRIHQPPRVICL